MPTPPSITCVIASQDRLGEGCLWDADSQSLWWLDIGRPTLIQRFTPQTGEHRTWTSSLMLTAIAKRKSGGFIVGGGDGLSHFDPSHGRYLCRRSFRNEFPIRPHE